MKTWMNIITKLYIEATSKAVYESQCVVYLQITTKLSPVPRLHQCFHHALCDFRKPKQIHHRQHGGHCEQRVEAHRVHLLHLIKMGEHVVEKVDKQNYPCYLPPEKQSHPIEKVKSRGLLTSHIQLPSQINKRCSALRK
nr:hypothetical protein Iba_scaffold15461CG0060 [Ipomoea batatas]